MLSENLFLELVKAASLASSADNMQPWEFRKRADAIEVFCAHSRTLPTDVNNMFAWMSIGAAIQNLVVAAGAHEMSATVEYNPPDQVEELAAVVRFSAGAGDRGRMVEWIPLRTTNRSPFEPIPLNPSLLSKLTQSLHGLEAGIHWTTAASDLERLAVLDANSSYIRLEHWPLYDELFDILRFSREEVESTRYGLDFESLGVPAAAVFIARQLRYAVVNKAVSRLGIGRLIAKMLASRLPKAGAICLVTALQRNPVAYMEAGRAMEQLWLAATAEGLSVHPYGVLPQYLTKVEVEPGTFLPGHAAIIENHREPFFSIFPGAKSEFPAIVLRVGKAERQSARSNIRLRPEEIIRQEP